MTSLPLSAQVSATIPNACQTRAAFRPCSYSHKSMRFDDSWRDLKPELQVLTRHKAGICNVIPRATNGVIVLGERLDGQIGLFHFTNLDFQTPSNEFERPVKVKKEPKPKKEKINILDLL